MSRFEECTKCGFTQVYDTFRSICNRCNYDTKPKVVEKPRTDMHDSHDFVMGSWIPEPEMKKEEPEEESFDCYLCGELTLEYNGSHSGDYFYCDECLHDDVEEECLPVLPTNAALRKGYPVATGVIDYFPDALLAIAEVSKVGNEQHNPGKPLHWDKTKSTDHADALVRHLIERGTFDTDGMRHSAKVAWRALALLQAEIEKHNYER